VLVITAACFGVLMAGMMVFSGTIWVPVVVHGLYNFPLAQFSGDGDGGGIITARFIVFFTVIGLAQIAVGLALVWYSDHEPVRIKRLMVRWKLIEDPVR
jgi:membrane protease YdiL (CAAX protease family)